jgi:lysophospholipase L1-like esterase
MARTGSLLFLAATAVGRPDCNAADPHARWEKEIAAFEAADLASPPPTNAVLFVGSSSIRLWESLADDFQVPVIRRGFGGSEMADSVHFADRIVLPYRPKQIVVYAGENDVAAGKAPERVVEDFEAFVRKVHRVLPETRVAYISMKPSPARWHLADKMRSANRQIAEFTRSDERLAFIDVFSPMLGPDGKPREELFVSDKLHLNRAGYALWTERVRPHLAK